MSEKAFDIVRLVCIAVGVVIAMLVFRGLLKFSPIVGGALGGGVGVLLGYGFYGIYRKIRS